MNRDDIIRMAREAGLWLFNDSEGHCDGITDVELITAEKDRDDVRLVEILMPFANLVAAAERERIIAANAPEIEKEREMTEESNNVGVFKAPSYIHFMGYEKTASSLIPHASIELMKMSRDGIWVNPDIPVEETAKQVLEILDNALKNMVRIAVEEEREACALLCDRVAEEDRHVDEQAELCAFAIRERGAP